MDDIQYRHSSLHAHGHSSGGRKGRGEGEAETEAGRHGAGVHGVHGLSEHGHGATSKDKHESAEAAGAHDKKDQQHRRDDVYDRHNSPVSQGEKEGLKTNPELKNRQVKDPRLVDPANKTAKQSEHDKREERYDAQSVPNSVFGQDRVTLSPETRMVPAVTRKAEAVGVKKQRQKYLPPGLNNLAAKANPPAFQEFLDAFVKNFSDTPSAKAS